MKRFLQHIDRINEVYYITQCFPPIDEFKNLNIEETIERALGDVIKDMQPVGINVESPNWYNQK